MEEGKIDLGGRGGGGWRMENGRMREDGERKKRGMKDIHILTFTTKAGKPIAQDMFTPDYPKTP